MRSPAIAVALSLALGAPAAAQEPIGTISGTLGLDDVEWTLLEDTGEPDTRWTRTEEGISVRLVGRASREAPDAMPGALVIRFETVGSPAERQIDDFEIRYHPQDESEDPFVADATNSDLNLDALSVAGDRLTVAGRFSGKLVEGGTDRILTEALDFTADMEGVTSVDAAFQGTIPRAD